MTIIQNADSAKIKCLPMFSCICKSSFIRNFLSLKPQNGEKYFFNSSILAEAAKLVRRNEFLVDAKLNSFETAVDAYYKFERI